MRVLAVAMVLALGASTARAEATAPRTPPSRCEALIETARLHYNAERYAQALAVSQEAYACDPQPALLFSMGQISFNLGAYRDAETYYTQFLATNPDSADAALALQALAVTRERIAAAAKPVPVVVVSRPADKLAWGFAIGGGVSTIASVALYVTARQRVTDTSGAYADYAARVDRARDLRIASFAFGGVGAALAIAATIKWATRTDAEPRTQPAKLTLAPITGDIVGLAFAGEL